MKVQTTTTALQLIDEKVAIKIAELAAKDLVKFNGGELVGQFNRYLSIVKGDSGVKPFLVLFNSNESAIVMTYDEALKIPVPELAEGIRQLWGD